MISVKKLRDDFVLVGPGRVFFYIAFAMFLVCQTVFGKMMFIYIYISVDR